MRDRHTRNILRWMIAASAALIASTGAGAAFGDDDDRRMTLHSATFEDGATLPLSMIGTIPGNCTANGATGGNMSPQLTWKHAPDQTRSFVVIVYDVVAQFTHWAMYNIPASTTSLPENAGIPGSSFGVQNGNDFFLAGYNGPCPPTSLTPLVHKYVITVYALDSMLPIVPTFGDFVPAGPEGLYHELIGDEHHGEQHRNHVLASASIAGFYSAAASTGN
jgi:Raf kinase inhibitor-like YbhB/YbcL family protein